MTSKIDGVPPPAVRPAELGSTSPAQVRSGEDRSQPVAAVPPADSMRLTGEAEGLQALQRELGSEPAGVDANRVSEIRAALADGSYRVDPQQVASRMLALESELGR